MLCEVQGFPLLAIKHAIIGNSLAASRVCRSMRLPMLRHIDARARGCVCVCVGGCVWACAGVWVCGCVGVCVCERVSVCGCVRVWMCTCMRLWGHICIYIYIHACWNNCTCTLKESFHDTRSSELLSS